MKVRYYKWVLAIITAFCYFVSLKLYKEFTGVDEDTVESTFAELDSDHNGVLSKKEQSFLRFCAGNSSVPSLFSSASPKFLSLNEFQLGVRSYLAKADGACRSDLQKITDPYEIEKLAPKRRRELYREVYDLNKNGLIEWNEYTLVNKLFGTDLGESVTVFINKDADGDFVLSKEEQ